MRLLAALALVLLVPAPLLAQQPGTSRFKGQWTNPRGHVYAADFTLEIKPDGAAEGAITWTLVKSPRENEQAKLGRTGVEHVRGRYDAGCRVLTLEGWRKDDPDSILGLDTYRLVLSDNGQALVGPTRSHGSWEGRFDATRADAAPRPAEPRRRDKEHE